MNQLHAEIFEQPERLAALLQEGRPTAERIAREIARRNPRFVFLAARGTSDNAGRYANYLWGAVNRLPLALATPSLFTYYGAPPVLQDALVVGISQSGQSPDIVSVVEEGRRQGCLTLVITNAPDSPLASHGDEVFDLKAGVETAVAATKTYTSQLAVIAMLSAALAGEPARWDELARVPGWVAEALRQDDSIRSAAERYRYMTQSVVLGRGFNYATAFEWALKLKELTYVVAEPYSSADFHHGPMAVVEPGFPVLAVAPGGAVFPAMFETLHHLHEDHTAELVVISDRPEALALGRTAFPLPQGIPEWLTPIVAIVLGQLFAMHLTTAKGYDPEQPRSITKITETE